MRVISLCIIFMPFFLKVFCQQGENIINNKIVLSEDAAWCWFSDPRVVHYKGDKEAVYFSFINSKGDVMIKSFNLLTKRIDKFTLHKELQVDDHNVPSILILPDGKLLAFYNEHNGSIFMRRSRNPEDISDWEEETVLLKKDNKNRYCYTNPIMLSNENNRIYLFGRNIVRNESGTYTDTRTYCIYSDNLGKTWSNELNLLHNNMINDRPYVKYNSDNKSRIDFLFTNGHPTHRSDVSLFHMYYEDGIFYQTNGSKLSGFEDVPININSINKVYDANISNVNSWIWDIALDQNKIPVVAYVKFTSELEHIYSYARWNGKEWEEYDIVDAGKYITKIKPGEKLREPHYSGGIVFDHKNPENLFLSRKIDGVFEIEKKTRVKKGLWITESITTNSKIDNLRPFVVNSKGENSSILLWMEGSYYHYTDFETKLIFKEIQYSK